MDKKTTDSLMRLSTIPWSFIFAEKFIVLESRPLLVLKVDKKQF